MDINLAHMLQTIFEAGNHMDAAERLCVIQSSGNTRIKMLEDVLGGPPFERSKVGATLTPAGEKSDRRVDRVGFAP